MSDISLSKEERLLKNKNRIFLEYLNEISKNIMKDSYVELKKIEDFQNIEAHDVKTPENEKIYEIFEKEISTCFSKEQLRFFNRKIRNSYAFIVIGYMADDLGYEFKKIKTRQAYVERKKITYAYYSIIKKE
jgi:hypothetical protein